MENEEGTFDGTFACSECGGELNEAEHVHESTGDWFCPHCGYSSLDGGYD